MSERRTCPECNFEVRQGRCINSDRCMYRGAGWTQEERQRAWAMHGVEERSVGFLYDYTGRSGDDWS